MGMGSYDESEQNRLEEAKDDVEEGAEEQITTETYEGDVSYDTPDTADVLMENFKQNKDG